MELFDTTTAVLDRAIAGASLRQQTLAGNLANANTPGFQRQDVDFQGALRGALNAAPDASSVAGMQFQAAPDGTGAMTADGNGIDTDAESARLAQNGLLYQALVGVTNARADIMRAAIGNGT